MKNLITLVFLMIFITKIQAQIEKFPNQTIFQRTWKTINLDSSSSIGIGCGNEMTFGPKFPATFFRDSTGCLTFDAFCYNPSKGFSNDFTIRNLPYRINPKDSLILWYGAFVHFKNWTTGQTYYKPDTIEILYTYLDSSLLKSDTSYPNASHMRSLGFLITTQDSLVMKRYSKSLSHLIGQGQSDTIIYIGFRKNMFTQDCAAWIDNLYMSNSGLNSTKNSNSFMTNFYPNPGKEGFNIRSDEKIKTVLIRDVYGKLVLQPSISNNFIETSNLAAGIYLVEIHSITGKISVGRWVKE